MNIHNNSGNIVKGDGNTVTATNTGNISEQVQISDDEWIQIEKAFGEIASGLDVNSKEHMLAVAGVIEIVKKITGLSL